MAKAPVRDWVSHVISGFVYATVGSVAGFLSGLGISSIVNTVTGGTTTMNGLATTPLTVVFVLGVASLGFFYGIQRAMQAEDAPN